jgi:hypothetical protein
MYQYTQATQEWKIDKGSLDKQRALSRQVSIGDDTTHVNGWYLLFVWGVVKELHSQPSLGSF